MRGGVGSRLRGQQGVALLAVLVVMLVALALAVASVRAASLAAKMASVAHDREQALVLAEAALLDAQRDIEGGLDPASPRAQALAQGSSAAFADPCASAGPFYGLCQGSSEEAGAALVLAASASAGVPFGLFTGAQLSAPLGAPSYLIEHMNSSAQGALYRISSQARASLPYTGVALQVWYRKPANAPGQRLGWRELGNWQQLQAASVPAAGQP